jgi:hypothetical protein
LKFKYRIIFFVFHLLVIIGAMIWFAYWEYPYSYVGGGGHFRRIRLVLIYDELHAYKKENGRLPGSLESLLHYDEEEDEMYIRDKPLFWSGEPNDLAPRLRYQVMDQEPVITDLGNDKKYGGTGWNIDITYPRKYQKHFSFIAFMRTKVFLFTLLGGLVFGFGLTFCSYKIWKKVSFRPGALGAWIHASISTILLLFTGGMFAYLIMLMHLYPSH